MPKKQTEDDVQASDDKTTAELTPPEGEAMAEETAPLKPKDLTVRLKPLHERPEDTVQGFAYPSGDGFGHWSLGRDGYEVPFTDLTVARSFMAAAIATGGLEVASDSPLKLREKE